MRFRRSRHNPDLILLTNPGEQPALAPAAWSAFHQAEPDDAEWQQIPDIKGLPSVCWSLGFFDGGEWVGPSGTRSRVRTRFNASNGPWLVSSPNDRRALWVVARSAAALKSLSRFDGFPMAAIYYFPNETSGKYDPDRGYRHEFGEGGRLDDGRRKEWPETWPLWERVSDRCYEIVGPHRVGFVVEPRGIVG